MRKKILIVMLAVLNLLAVPLILVSILTTRNEILTEKKESLLNQNFQNGIFIKERLEKYIQMCRSASGWIDFTQLSKNNEVHKTLLEEAKRNNLKDFYYISAQGHAIIFNTELLQLDFDPNMPLIQEALSGKSLVYGPNKTYDANKEIIKDLVISIKVPFERNGKTAGYIGIDFGGEELSALTKSLHVSGGGYAFIVKSNMDIIAHPKYNVLEKDQNLEVFVKADPLLQPLIDDIKNLHPNETKLGKATIDGAIQYYSVRQIPLTDWTLCLLQPNASIIKSAKEAGLKLFLLGFFITLLLGVFAYYASKFLTDPIVKIAKALKDISAGDGNLNVALSVKGRDEIAQLSDAFNTTIKKIRHAISLVAQESAVLENVGVNLSSNMTQTASAINEISANIDGVKQQTLTQSSSVTETSATIEQIIRTIRQFNTSIENQAANVTESSASIEQMIANIASVAKTLEKNNAVIKNMHTQIVSGKDEALEANTIVQQLAEKSGSLLEASQVIQNIASQTNLLAMNAAIEAAHAGTSGKGFAVVADEIRKLAEESNVQGKQIDRVLRDSIETINKLTIAVTGSEKNFGLVYELANTVLRQEEAIAQAMKEQETGSKEVLSAIKDINNVTQEVRGGSEEMLNGGTSVAKEMEKLNDLTRIVQDSMNEMAAGAEQINKAMQEVNEITQKNKASIDNLVNEVKKFKV